MNLNGRTMFILSLLASLMFLAPLAAGETEPNLLPYEGGNLQISSEVNEYENLIAGTPIRGSVMITHHAKDTIDARSFRLGNQALKVELVQTVPMSSYSDLVITIYKFQLAGMSKGIHTLAPINVKVAGKDYQAAPLTLEIQ